MTPFKLLSLLLAYPDHDIVELRDEIACAAGELEPSPARDAIVAFADDFASQDALVAQLRYVQTFDFSKRAALNLTYWSHGDRRQRGVALLKLKRVFARLGLEPSGDELPDHLALLLEAADILGPHDGAELLREFRAPIELIRAFLHEQENEYAKLFDALAWLLGPLSAADADEALRLAAAGPPDETVGLEPVAPPEVMPV